jgi:hypothetical protein
LCRSDGRNIQLSELEFCFHSEEILRSLYQSIIERKAHIPDLKLLKDVFFKAGVFDLHVILEIEGVVVVEVCCNGKLLANLSYYTHVDLLIKLESTVALLSYRDGGVIDLLKGSPKIECYKSPRYKLNITSSKDPVEYRTNEDLWNKASAANRTFTILRPGPPCQ